MTQNKRKSTKKQSRGTEIVYSILTICCGESRISKLVIEKFMMRLSTCDYKNRGEFPQPKNEEQNDEFQRCRRCTLAVKYYSLLLEFLEK